MKYILRVAILGLLMVVVLSITIAAAQAQEQVCSQNSDVTTFVVITNDTNYQLNLFWIDYDCNEVDYGVIEPGQAVVQSTSVGHPWIVRRSDTGAQVGDMIMSDSAAPVVTQAACSLNVDVANTLNVANNTDSPATFYWVDYDCNEVEWGTLNPGESVVLDTFNTHPWLLRDANTGALLSKVVATALVAPASP